MSDFDETDGLPDFFTVATVSKALQAGVSPKEAKNWDTRNTRRRLRRAGCLFKNGGLWMTSKDKLRQHWPELLDVLHRKGT